MRRTIRLAENGKFAACDSILKISRIVGVNGLKIELYR